MITVARESRGWTQSELAGRLTIAQGALSKIEGGIKTPSQELIKKLAKELDYPVEFFCSPEPIYGLGLANLYHRKRQALSNVALARIHAQVNIRRIHISRLLKGVTCDSSSIRRIEMEYQTPEEIARIVRAEWNLPSGPIQNLTAAIETAGGIVIICDFGTSLLDAVSQWLPDVPPLFFVNSMCPGDRLRYTLAHELGHIVMHEVHRDDMEREADHFAAELMMPAREIRPYLDAVDLPKLATLKTYWKVSMAALLKRATDLNKLTERRARYLWMRMGQLGYRTREPVELDIPQEHPTALTELVTVYAEELGYSFADLGSLLTASERQVRVDYFGKPGHLRVIRSHLQRDGVSTN